jgi:hypothetical protein
LYKELNKEKGNMAFASWQNRRRAGVQRSYTVNPQHDSLCKALVCSSIPWNKLSNPVLWSFLEKYCVIKKIPDESTLRKNYLQGD